MKENYPYNTGYIHIPITLDKIKMPSSIELNNDVLNIKTEFHVSLVCVKDMVAQHGDEIEQKVLDFFYQFVEQNDVSFEGFTGEYRLAERTRDNEYRQTIVGMCIVSNLDKFYSELNSHLGTDFDNQPTHVTLYTLGLNKGIGLNNQTSFAEKTTDITEQVLSQHQELKNLSYE